MSHPERADMRKIFFDTFHKYQNKLPLETVEAQLIDIILMHPEYQALLSDPEHAHTEHFIEQNPFLHMSLHLALREQLSTNRPQGVKLIYQQLCEKYQDHHTAEHKMMDCLAQILWEAQQSGMMPDENNYLQALRTIS